ncbi:hypothetical protein CLAFUW4_04392 [Fulvia fulva]|uniref:Uncharacterized protein n=1 Tax=Passalora fulva TaxID=5499 RepID=A0A9Q8LDW4_PASFU|nr:uncharacterized protein CLAFUR5_04355 [Fulvia fulva]KAK4626575.1 hypothetical protein CLAFUR4_04378 [Fulvia fulva]KAK4628494.1 hypothetical protein CLAFUR0_04380 [Fulvia fulva]UJO15695.1 hypothetical protein CLAFUR5_04355 [Fulvia fulva]WPV13525.1 hypothetical protein CLAFUW4_04392 [Fulvia fulva]WPV28182.1 hypothetical protein CLAFUW7_04382 [Fulvia fulva]
MARGIYQSQPRPRITNYCSDTSSSSRESEDWNEDENGVRFACLEGLPIEEQSGSKHRTRWVQRLSTDRLNPEASPYDSDNKYENQVLGSCGAILVRSELMSDPIQDFKTLAANAEESTRHAVKHLFNTSDRCLREEFRNQGIWGSDSDDPWVLVFERLYVSLWARRHGWASKLVTRLLEEVVDMARRAHKAVVVLTMPFAPEKEVKGGAVSWEEGLRSARAFWRSLGFVRMGETLFFGWTRNVQCVDKTVCFKNPVQEEDLDYDSDVDGRVGNSKLLLR